MSQANPASTDSDDLEQPLDNLTPTQQQNIRNVGHYMVINLCPPRLINEHLPHAIDLTEQMQLYRAHCTVRDTWKNVLLVTSEPYFSQFIRAISYYTKLLSQIQINTDLPMPKAIDKYSFDYKTLT